MLKEPKEQVPTYESMKISDEALLNVVKKMALANAHIIFHSGESFVNKLDISLLNEFSDVLVTLFKAGIAVGVRNTEANILCALTGENVPDGTLHKEGASPNAVPNSLH